MAMVVQHNIAAQLALGELNKNNDRLRKSLEKVSNGQKINSAKDDASGYVISEKMREMVRTLAQDHQNVQNGSALFKIADGGINNIVEELRTLKELAIDAANDTNTDIDRATIQKVFDQKMANINDIATETNYNGIPLLDGTWGDHNVTVTKFRWVGGSGSGGPDPTKIVHSGAVEPTGSVTTILSGDYTITDDGVYELAAGYSGTITINAQNVKITQATSATLSNVYMVGPSGGDANLWIEDLNIKNSQDKNFIKFQGSGNTFNFKGTNNLNVLGGSSAIINVGGGLTVEGGTDGKGTIELTGTGNLLAGVIGADRTEKSTADITVNSGNFDVHSPFRGGGAVVGSGYDGSIGNLQIKGGTFTDHYMGSVNDAIIGGGGKVGDITIDNATIKALGHTTEPAVGSSNERVAGNIKITNSYIYYRGTSGAAIGTAGYGDNRQITEDITIENCQLDINTQTGAGIGSGQGGHVGDIKIINTDLSKVVVTGGGEVVGKGVRGTCGRVIIENNGGGGGSGGHWEPYEEEVVTRKNPLKIHHGPKANQHTNFYIGDLHTKSLGTKDLVDSTGNMLHLSDYERFEALSYDRDKQMAWLETLRMASNRSLDNISVTTQKNANIAIRVVEGSLDVALDEATYVGSYLQRLDHTDANVVTMNENVQAAESTIRDADMAKEMTDYTKNNVLQQAAQAMLAQANQNGSAVLSLLQ